MDGHTMHTDIQDPNDVVPVSNALDAQTFWTQCSDSRLSGLQSRHITTDELCLEAYDVEVDAARRAVSALLNGRNRLHPIVRLPPELLIRIMQECAGFHATRTITRISTSWLALTHVCKAFRDLAIGYPMLWTNINTSLGRRWYQEFLKRSKGTLLGLHVELGINLQFAKELQRYMDTVERFSITAVNPIVTEPVILLLASCCPKLREATLVGAELWNPMHTLVSVINNAPLLQDLSITNFDILWNPQILPSLRRLEVDFSNLHDVPLAVNFMDVLDCLRASPTLEHLKLMECLPGLPPSGVKALVKVALPCLSTLILYDNITLCLAMLEIIETGHLTRLDLHPFHHGVMSTDCGERLASIMKRHFRLSLHSAMFVPEIRGYCLQAWRDPSAQSDGYGTKLSPWDHPQAFNTPALAIFLDVITSNTIATLCKALPLSDLRSLSINLHQYAYGDTQWPAGIWEGILAPARRLQSLRVYETRKSLENTPSLSRLLATPRPYISEDSVYLPSLTSLTLGHVKLGGIDPSGKVLYRQLLQYLHIRARLGAGVRALRFEDCSDALRVLDRCFYTVPGLTAVEHVGDGSWDTGCSIQESDAEACIDIGTGDASVAEDVEHGWWQ